jgi:hypothetical protein
VSYQISYPKHQPTASGILRLKGHLISRVYIQIIGRDWMTMKDAAGRRTDLRQKQLRPGFSVSFFQRFDVEFAHLEHGFHDTL